ncbi:MAG: hypothetical protein QF415_12690 [Candidatus Undinarchaeales archaeon]|jgi:hypothetical protein|nr:hypothetical protein [Candidatus Undinarchaeales archaeon]MDP7492533.1 hypothetical protein [Candidatus Undinarchaeales archaeon]
MPWKEVERELKGLSRERTVPLDIPDFVFQELANVGVRTGLDLDDAFDVLSELDEAGRTRVFPTPKGIDPRRHPQPPPRPHEPTKRYLRS